MTRDELLGEIKRRLCHLYGSRLHGVVLFGSEARKEATPESDIDIMVLIEGEFEYGIELRKCIHALYPLVSDGGRSISPVVVHAEEYEAAQWPLYRNAHREGILA